MEMTLDQKKALALAGARRRRAEGFGPQISPDGSVNPMVAETPNENGYSPSSVPLLDPINAFGTALAENIPFVGKPLSDFGNQVDAAFASMVEGKPVTAEDRAKITQGEQDQFPAASVTGAIAGNVLPLAPLAATKAGQVAFGLTGALPQRLGMGALSGSLIAGGDQLIRSGDPEKIKDSMLWGGALGAAGGAAAPVIEDALFAIGRKFGMGPKTGAESLSRPSRDQLIRVMAGNGGLGESGAANIRAAGPNGMLVDATPAAADVLDTALQRGGPGVVSAKAAVDTRANAANVQITKALDETLGRPRGVRETETGLRVGSAEARGNAYDTAYAKPIDYSSNAGRSIEGLMKRVPADAIRLANKMMQGEGVESAQILAKIADDGTVTYFRMPDVRQLDYITRALNQMSKTGEGAGALGGQTDMGRIWGNVSKAIRGQVKAAVPEYATALQTAARPIEQREALLFGQNLLKPNVTRSEAIEGMRGMSEPQTEYVKAGARAYIDDVLANVRDVIANPNLDAQEAIRAVQMLTTRASREKLAFLLRSTDAANRLYGQLTQAAKSLELRAKTAAQSRTFGRGAVDEAIANAVDGGGVGAALRGEPIKATQRLIQSATGRDAAGVANLKDQVYAELANALTSRGGSALDMLESLARRYGAPVPNAPFLAGGPQAASDYAPPVFARP